MMTKTAPHPLLHERPQTVGEEIANAISHGIGFLLAVASLPSARMALLKTSVTSLGEVVSPWGAAKTTRSGPSASSVGLGATTGGASSERRARTGAAGGRSGAPGTHAAAARAASQMTRREG